VLEKVATFPYLGRILAADNKDNAAVAAQLTKARTSFYAMSKQVLSKHTTREVKVSIFRAVVQAQLLYASETWHMTTAIRNKIDTFQQRTLRHCLGMQPTLRNGHPLYPKSEDVLKAAHMPRLSQLVAARQRRFGQRIRALPPESLVRHSCFSVALHSKTSATISPLAWSLLAHSVLEEGHNADMLQEILDLGEAQQTDPPPTAHGAPTGSEP